MKHPHFSMPVKRALGMGLLALLVTAAPELGARVRAQGTDTSSSHPEIGQPDSDADTNMHAESDSAETGSAAATPGTAATTGTAESVIENWPKDSRATASAMIGKYGQPTRFTAESLIWIDNSPWDKTVVYRNAWSHLLGKKDFLEQTVAYQVPSDKVEDLKRFDRRLEVNSAGGQLSARSDSEAMNYLALNLADEIVSDKRNVEDARAFFMKVQRLSKAGKSSAYMDGLLFTKRSESEPQTQTPQAP
jgi:hypothetical protein